MKKRRYKTNGIHQVKQKSLTFDDAHFMHNLQYHLKCIIRFALLVCIVPSGDFFSILTRNTGIVIFFKERIA